MSLILAISLSVLAMTLIVGARYLAVSGGFALLTRARFPGLYDGLTPQIRREIYWSLASAFIYGAPAGLLAWGWQELGWTRVYTEVSDYPLWWLPVSVFVYLALHDTWFYWTHRWMHWPRLFRVAHAVHHASRPPTAWAAMSFHPWEALTGAVVIPVLVLTIPIHVAALGVVLTVMTVMGVTNHMGWELFPRPLVEGKAGNWLITASHHQRHHQHYGCNYGLYFRFWDRLCGTDKGLGSFDRPAARALAPAAVAAFQGTEVDIRVQGLRNTNGIIRLCLTRNPAHFPNCDGDPAAVKRSVPAAQAGLIRLGGIAAGAYALAVIHDENGNGRLDRMLAIPREGFGFSRNPRIRMGPPRYEEVRFDVAGGRVQQVIVMKYLL